MSLPLSAGAQNPPEPVGAAPSAAAATQPAANELRERPEPAQPIPPPPYGPSAPQEPARELRYRALSMELGGGYSVPSGSTAGYVNGGANAGAALDWFPSAALPIGMHAEGSYTWLKPAGGLLALNNVGYNKGQQDLLGGDIDLRLDLTRLPSRRRLYLLAGVGWYRTDTTLQEVSGQRICGLRYCDVFQTLIAQEHDTSPWEPSWNAGIGWEVALDRHTALFIEAHYRHIRRPGGVLQLVPISLGLRF